MDEQNEVNAGEPVFAIRTTPMQEEEILSLENDLRDVLAEHDGDFASDDYGVRAVYDGDEKVYAPILDQGVDIIGAMVLGHVAMGDISSTAMIVHNLLPAEVDALEFGWFALQNPAILSTPEMDRLDIRMVTIGLKLAKEFLN